MCCSQTQNRSTPQVFVRASSLYHGFIHLVDFTGGLDGKESACNARDPGSILGPVRCLVEGNGNPLQYSCLKTPMNRRILTGYSSWGHKRVRQNLVTKQQMT